MKHISKEDEQAFKKSISDLRQITTEILDHIEILGDVTAEEDFIVCLKQFAKLQKTHIKIIL